MVVLSAAAVISNLGTGFFTGPNATLLTGTPINTNCSWVVLRLPYTSGQITSIFIRTEEISGQTDFIWVRRSDVHPWIVVH